uniref:Uncharacterized protein n=1 Tax=Aegilops tauschii subsp. strangulata TaxID=200361 RepID=A0A453EB98_AEGTS
PSLLAISPSHSSLSSLPPRTRPPFLSPPASLPSRCSVPPSLVRSTSAPFSLRLRVFLPSFSAVSRFVFLFPERRRRWGGGVVARREIQGDLARSASVLGARGRGEARWRRRSRSSRPRRAPPARCRPAATAPPAPAPTTSRKEVPTVSPSPLGFPLLCSLAD